METIQMTDKRLLLPEEFGDVQDIIDMGAVKHGADSWLKPGVFTFGARNQSKFRHQMKNTGLWYMENMEIRKAIQLILALLGEQKYNPKFSLDDESQKPHLLHDACNSLMFHTVIKRGILKPGDK